MRLLVSRWCHVGVGALRLAAAFGYRSFPHTRASAGASTCLVPSFVYGVDNEFCGYRYGRSHQIGQVARPRVKPAFKDASLPLEWAFATKDADSNMKTTSAFAGEAVTGGQRPWGASDSLQPVFVIPRMHFLRAFLRAEWRKEWVLLCQFLSMPVSAGRNRPALANVPNPMILRDCSTHEDVQLDFRSLMEPAWEWSTPPAPLQPCVLH